MSGYNIIRVALWIACALLGFFVADDINLRTHPRVVVIDWCGMDQPPQPPAATYPLTFPDSALTTRRSGRLRDARL
jgi:hypothetical protein